MAEPTQGPESGLSKIPPSRRMADELRAAISAGEFGPGDRLPSERVLARRYGTARNTARQAIAILIAEGLVHPEHGRGAFVRRPTSLLRLAHDRYARRHRDEGRAPFRVEAERHGWSARVELYEVGAVPAPRWVGEKLGLHEGTNVLRRRNRYLADERPVQLVDTYVPWAIAAGSGLLKEVPAPGGIYAALEALGHRLDRVQEDVTARMPTPTEVEALVIVAGVPVLEVRHTSFDQRGEAFEVTRFVLPADRNELSFELPTD